MKRSRSGRPASGDPSARRASDIDQRYGLEPVFEPGREPGRGLGAAASFQSIQCPYCGERFVTLVDASAGAASYIEDCQVCCQPIEFELQVDAGGSCSVSVHRS